MLKTLEDKQAGIKYAKNLLELATAKKHVSPLLEKLADVWMEDHNIREVKDGETIRYAGASKSHIGHSTGALKRFARFMKESHPSVKNMDGVTKDQIKAFLNTIDEEKLGPRTWNYYLVLLREMFTRHEPDASACVVLKDTKEKDLNTTHRKFYTEKQLRAIHKAAKGDVFIRPLIALGINTPLRLGDCCKLLWGDVDLENRFLIIKRTLKNKKGVNIPIWEQLQTELEKHPRGDGFVLPEQAAMYEKNPTGINSRLKAVFAKAGIKFFEKEKALINSDQASEKDNVSQVPEEESAEDDQKHKQTAKGPRRVNETAFQAFRVTWVTRALLCGVPDEIVIKATGHTTVQMVRDHYFQPGREDMRDQLEPAKPQLSGTRAKRPEREMVNILKNMTERSWEKDRARLLKLVKQLTPGPQRTK